jgi:uncharacterized protein YcbX
MSVLAGSTVAALYRYPVKGLSPESLERVELAHGSTMPFDRAYAVENGPGPSDPNDPKHLPKQHFVMLMRNEQLAALKTRFEDQSHTLTIWHQGAIATRGDLRTADGRASIEAFMTQYMGPALRGSPRVVVAPGHSFSDVAAKCLHIVNLGSVRALEATLGAKINPLRFRPNIVVDGWPAWFEFELIGKTVKAGGVALEVFKRTERCTATNVDPETGLRDLKIPSSLSRTYGHTDFGIYARVTSGGVLKIGDPIAGAD